MENALIVTFWCQIESQIVTMKLGARTLRSSGAANQEKSALCCAKGMQFEPCDGGAAPAAEDLKNTLQKPHGLPV
jgi:hypothetical protein